MGFMIQHFGFLWSVVIVIFSCLINVCLALFVLKDKYPTNNSHDSTIVTYLKRVLGFYVRSSSSRSCYIVCLLIYFISSLIQVSAPGVETLYQLDSPL